MSDRDRAVQVEEDRGRAAQRLDEAVSLQSRLRHEREVAKDTPDEVTVGASLRLADDQVAARERWLKSVDSHDY
jgi:hypothetical protein